MLTLCSQKLIAATVLCFERVLHSTPLTGLTIYLSSPEGVPLYAFGRERKQASFPEDNFWASPIYFPERKPVGMLIARYPRGKEFTFVPAFLTAIAYGIEQTLQEASGTGDEKQDQQLTWLRLNKIENGLVFLNKEGKVDFLNDAAADFLGFDLKKIQGVHLSSLFSFEPKILEVLKTGQGWLNREFTIPVGERRLTFRKSAIPIIGEQARVAGVIDFIRPVPKGIVTRPEVPQMDAFANIIYQSPAMAEAVSLARMFAGGDYPVLLCGETGTGKELFAQAVHEASPRRKGPFVVVDCAALPKDIVESELFGYEEGAFTGASKGGRIGKLELAQGGTVFLDEIGELPLELQPKFLRALEQKVIYRLGGTRKINLDFRVVAATSRDLAREVAAGRFRADLYYRLNVGLITLPPLRERPGDIPLLAECFLQEKGYTGSGITPEALECLLRYDWPGNVRELQNVLQRAMVLAQGRPVARDFLPSEITGLVSKPAAAAEYEKSLILKMLSSAGGNKVKAARLLGVSRSTFYEKLKKYGLNPSSVRRKTPESIDLP